MDPLSPDREIPRPHAFSTLLCARSLSPFYKYKQRVFAARAITSIRSKLEQLPDCVRHGCHEDIPVVLARRARTTGMSSGSVGVLDVPSEL